MVLYVQHVMDTCRESRLFAVLWQIAAGSSDNNIRLWDIASGEQLALLKGHTDDVESLDFSAVSLT